MSEQVVVADEPDARRDVENEAEEWPGEREYVGSLVATLTSRLTPASCRWPRRPQCDCTRWYNTLAPQSLFQLNAQP